MARQLMETVEAIAARSMPSGNGCLIVERNLNRKGYPMIRCAGTMMLAYRVVYEAKHGPIPDGMCVLHKCDVRNCVNVEHLFLGTNDDNIMDKCRKNRSGKKLRIESVLLIRAMALDGAKQAELARRFNVRQSTISRIVLGQRWTHLTTGGAHHVSTVGR